MWSSSRYLLRGHRSHLTAKNVHFSMSTEQSEYIQKLKPPKKPENFEKIYPKKPLYWRTYGTDLLKEKHQVIGTVVLFSGCWLIASTVYEHFKVQKIERGELGEEARLDLEKKREYAAQKPDPKTLNLKLDLHDLNLYKSLRHLSFDEKDEKVEKQESQAHWASISFVDQIVPRKERERDIKSYELRKVDAEMRARANANQNNSDKTK